MDPIRIWYQSYVDEPNGKVYWERLRRHLATIVDPGTTVDVKGITPHDNYAHPIVEFRCAREVICNAVSAEREGYDAFVMGHFQDAGLYEARSVVSADLTTVDVILYIEGGISPGQRVSSRRRRRSSSVVPGISMVNGCTSMTFSYLLAARKTSTSPSATPA